MLFELDSLQKRYGDFHALKGVTLRIEGGSVGLLGPNGAGKSTFIKTLLGLLTLDGGSAHVLGYQLPGDAVKIRQSIGYMPENDCFLPYMSAIDYVSYGGRLVGMPKAEAFRRAHEVLYYVGLNEARYRTLNGFSTGMKQRVKLAQAIVHGPKLVFLDEPTNGLDPKGRDEMLELIEDVKARGVSVVLSSHLLADVERVCESVIMLNHGELLHVGDVEALKQGGDRVFEIETKNQNEKLKKALEKVGYTAAVDGSRLKVTVAEDDDGGEILKCAVENDIQIRHYVPGELTLEAAFLDILSKEG